MINKLVACVTCTAAIFTIALLAYLLVLSSTTAGATSDIISIYNHRSVAYEFDGHYYLDDEDGDHRAAISAFYTDDFEYDSSYSLNLHAHIHVPPPSLEERLQTQLTEFAALCEFKNAITNWPGFNWRRSPRWHTCITSGWNCTALTESGNNTESSSYAPCGGLQTWSGVLCKNGSTVSQLNLTDCGFTGTISPQLSALAGLSTLWLRQSNLTSTIPTELSVLTNMRSLNLRTNLLNSSIPSQFTTMTKLHTLILYENSLTGPWLPFQFFSKEFSQLSYINVRNNKLGSYIPNNISNLISLTYLNTRNMFIVGPIPSGPSACTKLDTLFLRSNSHTGTIPSELSTLTNLYFLQLFNMTPGLTGTIPSQLSACTRLNTLYLYNNLLTGSLPSELSTLIHLNHLDLHRNTFFGSIPSQFAHMKSLKTLYLDSNSLTGTIAIEFSALLKLQTLILSDNFLRSTIPHFISNFTDLKALILSRNKFSGSIPNIFSSMPKFVILGLERNMLIGLLPPCFETLKKTLIFLNVADNNLEGDPFFFIGSSKIKFVNISSNKFKESSGLELSYLSYNGGNNISSRNLLYLDISSNYFAGTLPHNIGNLFPNLRGFYASNNCFKSLIPTSFCSITSLRDFLANKLGSNCASTDVSNPMNALSRDVVNHDYSIPDCLLKLPLLETAHLIGNYLFGSISDISPSLKSLSLVGNALTSPIPKSVMLSYNLTEVQLSLNRLSGTLAIDAFEHMSRDSSIDFHANRISGRLPANFKSFKDGNNIDILTGNLFSCDPAIPEKLKNSASYTCGSSSIDAYQYAYLFMGILIVVLVISFYACRAKLMTCAPLLIIYFRMVSFPRTPLYSALGNPTFCKSCLLIATFMCIFNVSMKAFDLEKGDKVAFNNSYSTHYYHYGWSSAFMYVHGIASFVMMSIGIAVNLFLYLSVSKPDNKSSSGGSSDGDGDDSTSTRRSSTSSDRDDSITHAGSRHDDIEIERRSSSCNIDTPIDAKSRQTAQNGSIKRKLSRFFSFIKRLVSKQYRMFYLFQLANVVVTTGVNLWYVTLVNDTSHDSNFFIPKRLIPTALAVFKIFWANTFLMAMIQIGISSKLPERVVFGHYIFALIFTNILVPILTVFATDINCFYYTLQPLPAITEKFGAMRIEAICVSQGCDADIIPIGITQSISPAWIYSFQCGSSILLDYVPAVLAKYIISGMLMPALKLFILCFPPSSLIRNLSISKIKIIDLIMPYTYNALPGDMLETDVDARQFRTYRYLGTSLTDIIMIFTFGTACPFLTYCILFSVIINEVVNHLQVGSYLYDANENMKTDRSSIDTKAKLDFLSRTEYYGNSRGLIRSMYKPTVLIVLYFTTLFLFDMVADVYGNLAGIIAVFIVWIFVCFFLFSRSRLEAFLTFFRGIFEMIDKFVSRIKITDQLRWESNDHVKFEPRSKLELSPLHKRSTGSISNDSNT